MSQTKDKKIMPPAQALAHTIEGARDSFKWLKELQIEWDEKYTKKQDGSLIRKHQRIVVDAFTIYLDSLFQTSGKVHSLVRSYLPHPFIKSFQKHKLVRLSKYHRNNRAGHQSQNYGFVISIEDILSSDIDNWLSDAFCLVCTDQLPRKYDYVDNSQIIY